MSRVLEHQKSAAANRATMRCIGVVLLFVMIVGQRGMAMLMIHASLHRLNRHRQMMIRMARTRMSK